MFWLIIGRARVLNDIFLLQDLMGGVPVSFNSPAPQQLQLVARPTIDPPVFQSKWMALPVAATSKVFPWCPIFRLFPQYETLLAPRSCFFSTLAH